MNPTEYMIGDWVKHTNPKTDESYYAKVSGICPIIGSDHKQIGWAVRFHKDDEPIDNPCPVSCEPVPITPEILEANGFEKYGHRCSIWLNREDFDNHTEIEYRIDQNWFELKRMANRLYIYQLKGEVHYVHELQHLLRATGLNEMADSFVIEKGGKQ